MVEGGLLKLQAQTERNQSIAWNVVESHWIKFVISKVLLFIPLPHTSRFYFQVSK